MNSKKPLQTISYRNRIVQEDMARMATSGYDYGLLKGKRVLITGATGMLATYITYFLCYLNEKYGYEIQIIALVRNKEKAENVFANIACSQFFKIVVQDVCTPLVNIEPVDYIIHAAGNASPQAIINSPADIIKTNTEGTINILEYAISSGVKRILYTSTREVYGDVTQTTNGRKIVGNRQSGISEIAEEDVGLLDFAGDRSCYPESKRAAEAMFNAYGNQYGTDYVINRIAHVYGPGMAIENDGRIMGDLIGPMVRGEDIVLHSDGSAIRGFCYLSDAVNGMLLTLLKGEQRGIYNLSNETEPVSIKEAAELLIDQCRGCTVRLLIEGKPTIAGSGYSLIKRVALDNRKLEKLGWKPQVRLAEGMRRTVESFSQQ